MRYFHLLRLLQGVLATPPLNKSESVLLLLLLLGGNTVLRIGVRG
jgi:hypothetical protein